MTPSWQLQRRPPRGKVRLLLPLGGSLLSRQTPCLPVCCRILATRQKRIPKLTQAAWAEAVAETAKILSIDEADIPYPVVPISAAPTTATTTLSTTTASAPISAPTGPAADRTNDDAAAAAAGKSQPQPSKRGQAKRKAGAASDANGGAEADGKTDINGNGDSAEGANGNGNAESAHGAADEDTSKKARTDAEPANGTINGQSVAAAATSAHQAQVQAQQQAFAASFGGLFDPASLAAPVLPTQAEMGDILLEVRKRALREEYGV